ACLHALGQRYYGGQRIHHLMPEDSHAALPGATFFFAQRATKIRQHEQIVRQTVLAKSTASNAPSTGASREGECKRFVLVGIETRAKSKLVCISAQQSVHRLCEQSFARAIHEAQAPFGITSENRDVDFTHDGAQKGSCFKGAQTLKTQCFAE